MRSYEILEAARDLIADPRCWLQGGFTEGGEPRAYCSLGALGQALVGDPMATAYLSRPGFPLRRNWVEAQIGQEGVVEAQRARVALAEATGEGNIVPWNDRVRTRHKDVMAAFARAIRAEKTRHAELIDHEKEAMPV